MKETIRQRIIRKLDSIPAGASFTAHDIMGMFSPTAQSPTLQLVITAIREYPRASIEWKPAPCERGRIVYRMAEA